MRTIFKLLVIFLSIATFSCQEEEVQKAKIPDTSNTDNPVSGDPVTVRN